MRLLTRDRGHIGVTMSRRLDHHYHGRAVFTDAPRSDHKGRSAGRDERPSRHLPPALAKLAALAEQLDLKNAWRLECPRGRGHELFVFHDHKWRLLCTKGCREGDIFRAFGLPPDVLRYRPPAEPRPPAAQRYAYVDAEGNVIFEVVRRLGVEKGKRRFDVKGRARKGIVYRLAELQRAPVDEPVFWVEGEKDVETLRAHGLVAVTTSLGAYSYEPRVAAHFRGRTVVILPDNDEPGRMYGDKVAASLRGVAAKVEIVRLPGLPHKGDVSWWLEHGGKVDDLLQAARVPSFFKPVKGAPPAPAKAKRPEPGSVEAAILAAIDAAEHRSVTTDALPLLVARLPGEAAWNARAREPIIRYRDVPKAELAKARAGISRALRSLVRRGLIAKAGRRVRRARAR